MFTQNWLNGVRTWFSQNTRTRMASRNPKRRSLQRRDHVQIERLEDRSLLSALSISDATVVEGNGGPGTTNAVFTITLSAADTQTVSVTATTADGTATSGLDYTPLATVVTFNPGETSKTVTVLVNGDTLFEPNETFFVNLSNPVNAKIGDGQGKGTIINDD